MNLKDKIAEAPYGAIILFAMWVILTALCVMVYFIPTETGSDIVRSDFPKIISEMWKYVTGATVSALATLAGQNNRRIHGLSVAGLSEGRQSDA